MNMLIFKGCLPKNVFQNEIENFCNKSTRNLEGFMEKIFKHTSMKDTFTNNFYKKYERVLFKI